MSFYSKILNFFSKRTTGPPSVISEDSSGEEGLFSSVFSKTKSMCSTIASKIFNFFSNKTHDTNEEGIAEDSDDIIEEENTEDTKSSNIESEDTSNPIIDTDSSTDTLDITGIASISPELEKVLSLDTSGNNVLHKAALYNQVDFIKNILLQHFNDKDAHLMLETFNQDGDTMLHIAKKASNEQVLHLVASMLASKEVFGDASKCLETKHVYYGFHYQYSASYKDAYSAIFSFPNQQGVKVSEISYYTLPISGDSSSDSSSID
ncbi:MAG TPA: ankyrin repeat domain-containing protein [Candidatus Megaira endosymbiont of Nemacystus decipiens]|nr:ankyrin repeat domain-containing protein [Candidatus Megaera endosymbiont of Nemacystus decipiens]